MKKWISFLLAVLMMVSLFGCGSETDTAGCEELSFKTTQKYDELKKLDGTKVYIYGYMCSTSPADGSYMYLMNLPDQSCPFCLPNTSQLSNTIAVYPKKGKKIQWNSSSTPIVVVGTLSVSESEEEPFTDNYGYTFCFKIVDAAYREMEDSEVTDQMKAMKKIASSGIMTSINNMFNYLDFVCNWPNYYVNSYTDKDGNFHTGYYLWASDALRFLQTDNAQYNYGYADDYFDSLIREAQSLDMDGTDHLIQIIMNAENVAKRAVSDLENGVYTFEKKYVEKFETEDYVYTLTNGETYYAEYQQLYVEFQQSWLP